MNIVEIQCTSKKVERSWRTGLVQCMHSIAHTMHLHACAVQPLSRKTSVKKQRIVSHEECTWFHAKSYARVRFCRRLGPVTCMTKFLNVCKNFTRNVGHVKHYCPFTLSSFHNISQTLRKFCKECFGFFCRVKRALYRIRITNFWNDFFVPGKVRA